MTEFNYYEWLGKVLVNAEIKHFMHMNSRMEIWRKGYGLLCDVNGILYVYKKP